MDSKLHNLDTPQHFSEFGEVLKAYVTDSLNESKQPDAFTIIKEFRSIAGRSALKLVGNTMQSEDKIEYTNWELEARFWHIFELLLDFRTSDPSSDIEESKPYNSNSIFEKELLQKDRGLFEIWLIMAWLQENIKIHEKPNNLPVSKWSHSFISGSLKSADLDYPLRDVAANISTEDQREDHVFFKYIYELLLSGNFEEAYEECKFSDNVTLAMVICGMQEYLNPKVDIQLEDEFPSQQGIKKHALWRRTVFELSRTPQLDPYERAIYNYLSGTLPEEGLVSDSTWEADLLLNLNQILQINVENYLLSIGKIDQNELIAKLPTNPTSLQSVLNGIAAKHTTESEHPIRILIGSTILDTLGSVLHSFVEILLNVMKGNKSMTDILNEPYLLRIVTHLTILLDIITPGKVDNSDKVKLITSYINVLKLHQLYDYIPVYIKFLNEEDALDAYSFILSSITDSETRNSQLALMNQLQLHTANILRRTTQRVFVEMEPVYTPEEAIAISSEVSGVDKRTVHAVEWLLEGKLSSDAIKCIVAMGRRFLLNGKIKSLQYFFENNNIESLINAYKLEKLTHDDNIADDDCIKEVLEYQTVVEGYKMYEEWQKAITQLNSESNIPSLIEKFQAYTENTLQLVKTFLVELTSNPSSSDYNVLYEIRALYTPYFIIELHKGLVEAAKLLKIPTFIKDALNFISLVANETDSFYVLFQSSGKLKEYLQLVAHTATMLERD
ncbi:nucleoporin Nup84p [Monosporozyma servazzii]